MTANRRLLQSGSFRRPAFLAALLLLCAAAAAHASVAVLLEEPYGTLGRFSPSGHVAIYLNHVCAATPVQLRACRPGELGAVLSRYDGIGDHDWVAIPLVAYLYAVGQASDIPVTVTRADVLRLRDTYRREHLLALAPSTPAGNAPDGNWYELAGAAFDRTIYGFQVTSTARQDADLIAYFNDHPNRDVYNGMIRNCADFVRVTLNRFYPHAVRRNYLADFGLTSPKSVARGLAHYAAKHPEIDFQTFTIPQISGELGRSHAPVTLTEGIVREFGLPLAVLSPAATGVVLSAYLVHGRFAEPRGAPVLNLRTDVVLANSINLRETPAEAGTPTLPSQDGIRVAALR